MKKKLSLPARIAKAFVENAAITWLIIISAFGGAIFSYIDSSKNHFPEIEVAHFTIAIDYPGATAKEVDRFLTKEVEQVLAKFPKIDILTAQSYGGGRAILFLKFDAKQNVEELKIQVLSELELISNITRQYGLPPISISVGGIEQNRSLVFGVTSDKLSPAEMREKVIYLRDLLRSNIPGLASPEISGAPRKVVKIELNPGAMQLRKIGSNDILNAIKVTNVRAKVGNLKNDFRQIEVEVEGVLQTVSDIKNLVIAPGVQLQDIANVYESIHETDEIAEVYDTENGFQRAIFLSFGKIKKHNVTTVNRDAIAFVKEQMEKPYFQDIQVKSYRDQSIQATKFTNELMMNLVQTILIVFAILLLFLKFQPALNVTLAIPLVIAITLIIGYISGQDINSVYLAGYILSLGLLVDSATVVTEAIYRKKEEGLSAKEATIEGVQVVGTGLIISTVTSVLVFFPLLTLTGEMGEFFFDFAFVLPVALMTALFVALSLSPFLAFNILKKYKKTNKKENRLRSVITFLNKKYIQALTAILNKKSLQRKFSFIVLGLVLVSFFLFGVGAVKQNSSVAGLMESEFALHIDTPPGTSAKITNEIAHKIVPKLIDPRIKSLQVYTASPIVGGIRGAASRIQSHQASVYGIVYEENERPPEAQQSFINNVLPTLNVLSTLRNKFKIDPEIKKLREEGYKIWFVEYPPGVATLAPIVMEVRGPNEEIRRKVIDDLTEQLLQQPLITYAEKVTDPPVKERILYSVDEQKALQTGLTTYDVYKTLSLALGTDSIGQLFVPDAVEPIALEATLKPSQRRNILDLSALYLKNITGEMVPLSSVVTTKNIRNERVVYRRDQFQMDYMVAHTEKDTEGVTKKFIKSNVKFYQFPENGKIIDQSSNGFKYLLENGEHYEIFFDGELEQGRSINHDFANAILIALVFVYIVLVYQFKSFTTPFVVMSTIPLGFIGIVFGFIIVHFFTGIEMNPTGLLGVLALIGIVVNNSIMILETYDQFREKGDTVKMALIHSCDQRFRPIMLTSMTTFLGILTLLSNESWQSLSLVISMGLASSVCITIFLVPILYYLMNKKKDVIKVLGN